MPTRSIYPMSLLGGFAVAFVSLGIAPLFREDWLLENLLVFAAVGVLIATYRRWRLTNVSYTLICMFLVLHEIGAHYTYSLVPYDAWSSALTGTSISEWFGWRRNHYDRLIHFAYGLLILPPCAELLSRVTAAKGMWRLIVPVSFILSQSAMYELIEWVAAMVFGGELGTAYVGTQGDAWDAQKDIALAAAGAVLASASLAVWNLACDLAWACPFPPPPVGAVNESTQPGVLARPAIHRRDRRIGPAAECRRDGLPESAPGHFSRSHLASQPPA